MRWCRGCSYYSKWDWRYHKTDDRGYYEFCELNNGDYSITIDKSTLPEGYVITAQNRGDSGALDSDIDPDSGKSDTVPINGGSNTTLDGGIYRATYCIGDLIWFDDNGDGIQDSGENGVNGVQNISKWDWRYYQNR